jgi:hypothetical protein
MFDPRHRARAEEKSDAPFMTAIKLVRKNEQAEEGE